MNTLSISYRYLKSLKVILGVTLIVVSTYLSISYFHPSNNYWIFDGSFSWSNFLQFFLIDQLVIECFTFFIIAQLIILYSKIFKIDTCQLNSRSILIYQLKYLPLFSLSFLVFNPVSQSLRYLYHYYPDLDISIYFDDYFYNLRLYLTYLFPAWGGGYLLLNYNLYRNYKEGLNAKPQQIEKDKKIELSGAFGKVLVSIKEIKYLKRENRINYVFTAKDQLRTSKNLKEMASTLEDFDFIQINRSVIINLAYLDNYSFWENEKYIIRLVDGEEFVASRARINQMKLKWKLD